MGLTNGLTRIFEGGRLQDGGITALATGMRSTASWPGIAKSTVTLIGRLPASREPHQFHHCSTTSARCPGPNRCGVIAHFEFICSSQ